MKVCHIVPGYYPHYAAPFEYTRKLASRGVTVDVIAFARPGEALSEVIDGVHVRRTQATKEREHFSLQNTRTFIPSVLKRLKDKQYDLIHTYAFRGCVLLPVLGRHLGSKWILDIRTGNVASSRLRSSLADWVTRMESIPFDALIALDQQVGNKVLGQKRSFYIVPLGVDFCKFKPGQNFVLREELGIGKDEILIVFVSKLEPQRLIDRVLQSFAQTASECLDLFLLVVGNGEMLDDLQKLAETLHIANRVHFTGYVPYAEIQDYVRIGDIGLAYVPIVPQYNFQPPLKTVEFLACGLPTIATRTQGNMVFIQDGKNGLLVNDDSASVAKGIRRLVNDSALRQKLALNARSSVAEYDWRQIVEKRLLSVYESVLQT